MQRFNSELALRHTWAMLEIGLYLRELGANKQIPHDVRQHALRLAQDYPRVTEILILAKRDHGHKGERSLLSNVEKDLLVGERYRLLVSALKAEAQSQPMGR